MKKIKFKIFLVYFQLILSAIFTFQTLKAQNINGYKNVYTSVLGNRAFDPYCNVATASGNVILGEINAVNETISSKILLMKVDNYGNVLWSKEIAPAVDLRYYKLVVLSDESIVLAENSPYATDPTYSQILFYKFSKDGVLLWNKQLSVGPEAQSSSNIYLLMNMTEGLNLDLLVSVRNNAGGSLIARISSAGSIVWSKTFNGNTSFFHNAQCFLSGNKIVVVGLKYNKSYSNARDKYFFSMKLNYTDGSMEVKKDYYGLEHNTSNYGVLIPSPETVLNVAKLSNGNLVLTGVFFNFSSSVTYFYKVAIDSNLNFRSSVTYSHNNQQGSFGNYKTKTFTNGNINIIGADPNSYDKTSWFTIDSSDNIKRQFVIPFGPTYYAGTFDLAEGFNHEYSFVSSFVNQNNLNSRFIMLANANFNDAAVSACLGYTTAILSIVPWSVANDSWAWNSVSANEITSADYAISVSDALVVSQRSCTGVLPLTLIGFNGEVSGQSVLLNWKTENELQLHTIEVERSFDAVNYIKIATVTPKNLAGVNSYTITDNSLPPNVSAIYYRLKIVEESGNFSWSKIVLVDKIKNSGVVKIIPNPAASDASIRLTSSISGDGFIVVTDIMGRENKRVSVKVMKGINSFSIPGISNMVNGIYRVKVIAGSRPVVSSSLIVLH